MIVRVVRAWARALLGCDDPAAALAALVLLEDELAHLLAHVAPQVLRLQLHRHLLPTPLRRHARRRASLKIRLILIFIYICRVTGQIGKNLLLTEF